MGNAAKPNKREKLARGVGLVGVAYLLFRLALIDSAEAVAAWVMYLVVLSLIVVALRWAATIGEARQK